MLLRRTEVEYPRPDFPDFKQAFFLIVPTLFFWGFIIFYPFLFFIFGIDINFLNLFELVPKVIRLLFLILGIAIGFFGLILGCLGRIGRGFYLSHEETMLSTSWGHAVIRHPQYFLYITGFISLPLVTVNPLLLFLLLGVHAYLKEVDLEEEELLKEFGEKYKKYQKKVGKLFPKVRKHD